MKAADIVIGETYLFVATESQARKFLEGQPFTVTGKKQVWRRLNKSSRRVNRFFNEDGIGARADELEPLDGTAGNEPDQWEKPLIPGNEDPF